MHMPDFLLNADNDTLYFEETPTFNEETKTWHLYTAYSTFYLDVINLEEREMQRTALERYATFWQHRKKSILQPYTYIDYRRK